MSTHPRIEARVSAQERQQTILNARIEELSEDTTASFKQLSEDMTLSFKQLSEYLATMATKEDLSNMKAAMETTNNNMLLILNQILERLPQ